MLGGKVLRDRYLCRFAKLQRFIEVRESAYSSLRGEAELV